MLLRATRFIWVFKNACTQMTFCDGYQSVLPGGGGCWMCWIMQSGIQASIHGGGMQGGISAPPSTQGSIQGSCAQGLLNSRGYAGTGGMPSPQSLSGNGGGGNVGNGSGGNIIGTSAMSPQPYVSGQTSSAGGNMYGTSPAQMGQYRVQVGMQSATLQGNGGIQQVLPVQQSLTQTSAVGADGGGSDPDFMAMVR